MIQIFRPTMIILLASYALNSPAVAGQACEKEQGPCMDGVTEPLPPPKPGCIPTGEPNSWYCDGPPEPVPLEPWEEDLQKFLKSHHPEFPLKKEGQSVRADEIPLQYMREFIKSRNPNAVFEVGGFSVDDLSQILDRHQDELAQIPGYAGSGIDKDGIVISVTEPHGDFPTELEGAKTHLEPAITGVDLVGQ